MQRIAGLDESGRGCVIGDLVVGCVVMDNKVAQLLNIPDSKKVKSRKKREELYDKIIKNAEQVITVQYTAYEITQAQRRGFTMNEIETMMFATALENINSKNINKVYLDAADVNEKRFGNIIKKLSGLKCTFISEHKADDKYSIVGAASIVAKVTRDRALDELHIDAGNGYPADKTCQEWLKKCNGKFPSCVRTEWETVKRLLRN